MGQQLPPDQLELFHRVDEVLYYLWDPIGVSRIPEARDEYHGYLPHVFSLLVNRGATEDIIKYLVGVETERMGVSTTDLVRKRAEETAKILEKHRDSIPSRTAAA